jgi:type I restriction enzyme R subunit
VEQQGYDGVNTLGAFSDSIEVDGVEYTERDLNGFPASELPSKFSTPQYQILVVAEKYQTGFDEPLLHTMYVDRSLSGVQAVQTLGRLNRKAPGKDDTFVLDFVNESEDIEAAFQPFYERTTLEETTDPQHIYQLESELKRYPVSTDDDVDGFAQKYFSPENTGTEQAHAELSQQLHEPVERFKRLTEPEQDEFKSTLRDFIRLYKFQSQVVDYTDTELEKLYIFGRFLAKQLPRDQQDRSVNIDDELALRYYRLEQAEAGGIDLAETGGDVSVPTETGGHTQEDDEVSLSQLVARINEALGTDFTAADELFLQQVKEDALDDQELEQAAQVNSRSNFSYAFDERLTELFIDRMDENQDMFVKFMEYDNFQELITEIRRDEVYS